MQDRTWRKDAKLYEICQAIRYAQELLQIRKIHSRLNRAYKLQLSNLEGLAQS